MYRNFLTIALVALQFLGYGQSKNKIDVLTVYEYKNPSAFMSQSFLNIDESTFYDAKKQLSKNLSISKNTQILQSIFDRYDKVILPDFEIDISKEGLRLNSNQQILFRPNTVLKIEPNSLESYAILNVHGVSNVKIYNPKLIGDKNKHLGNKGEAGHGISILGSQNIEVKGFDIRNFWGDGIFLGRLNRQINHNVVIENGIVDNNRRNGISIVSVDGLLLKDVLASNSNGTKPMFGVDIEPHFWVDEAKNIKIINLKTYNNANGGFMINVKKIKTGGAKEVSVLLENYQDHGSYHGIALDGIPADFKDLSGFINFKGVKLEDNTVPIKFENNYNDKFKINVTGFEIISPKNKNFHTQEAIRVIRSKRNIQIK